MLCYCLWHCILVTYCDRERFHSENIEISGLFSHYFGTYNNLERDIIWDVVNRTVATIYDTLPCGIECNRKSISEN